VNLSNTDLQYETGQYGKVWRIDVYYSKLGERHLTPWITAMSACYQHPPCHVLRGHGQQVGVEEVEGAPAHRRRVVHDQPDAVLAGGSMRTSTRPEIKA
jgi:hypothetical protein